MEGKSKDIPGDAHFAVKNTRPQILLNIHPEKCKYFI